MVRQLRLSLQRNRLILVHKLPQTKTFRKTAEAGGQDKYGEVDCEVHDPLP